MLTAQQCGAEHWIMWICPEHWVRASISMRCVGSCCMANPHIHLMVSKHISSRWGALHSCASPGCLLAPVTSTTFNEGGYVHRWCKVLLGWSKVLLLNTRYPLYGHELSCPHVPIRCASPASVALCVTDSKGKVSVYLFWELGKVGEIPLFLVKYHF